MIIEQSGNYDKEWKKRKTAKWYTSENVKLEEESVKWDLDNQQVTDVKILNTITEAVIKA